MDIIITCCEALRSAAKQPRNGGFPPFASQQVGAAKVLRSTQKRAAKRLRNTPPLQGASARRWSGGVSPEPEGRWS